MVKTFGWVLRPCGSAGGAFGSTMLLHPHRTHGQGFWMGLPARRTYANRPPRSRYVWSSAKSLVHKQGRQGVQSHVLLGKCGSAEGAFVSTMLLLRVVPSSYAWSRLLDGSPDPQDLRKPVAGTFGAVLTRLLDGSCGLQDLRKPGAARGPRSRYGWSSAKFLVHKQGRQGVQWHVLAKATHFNGGDAGVDHHCAPGSDSMVGFSAISD